jgi:GNAT superfamily N-acetyltransferase
MESSTIADSVTFRKANLHDVPRILEITVAAVKKLNDAGNFQWNETYPLESDFLKDIENDELWVAEENTLILGFMAITTDFPPEYHNFGWDMNSPATIPHRLALAPEAIGKGLAQKFMLLSEKVALDRGHCYVRVDTNVLNAPMNYVFRKLGYEFGGETTFSCKGDSYPLSFNCYQKRLI